MVVQKVGEGQSGFWLGQKTSLSKRSCRKSSGRALHVAVVRQQSKWQKQSLTGKAATTTSVMVVPQLVQDLIFFISFGTPPTTFHVCLYIDKRNIRSPLKQRLLPIAQPMHMWQDFYSKSQPARIKIYHPNADLEIVAETSPLQLHHLHFLLWNGRFYTQREFMITFIGFPISYTYHATLFNNIRVTALLYYLLFTALISYARMPIVYWWWIEEKYSRHKALLLRIHDCLQTL